MRRACYLIFLMGVVIILLSGCGGYDTATERNVSGGAVSHENISGQAVSGAAATGQVNNAVTVKDAEKHRYCTDTNLYRDCEDGLLQSRLDGSCEELIEIDDYWKLFFVDKEWLYYGVVKDFAFTKIYRVPIEKDAEGYDIVKSDEQEEFYIETAEGGMESSIYVDSEFLLYRKAGDGEIVKFDRKSGKKKNTGLTVRETGTTHYMRCGDTFLIRGDDKLYAMDADGTDWKKIQDVYCIYLSTVDVWSEYAWNKDAYFYAIKEEVSTPDYPQQVSVYRYDVKLGKDEPFISRDQLRQAAQKAEGLERTKGAQLDVCSINSMFCQEDRLYVQVQVGWTEGKEYHMAYQMFYKGQEDKELIFDKKMTESMRACRETKKGSWKDDDGGVRKHVVANDGKCVWMTDGKAYFVLNEDKNRLGCYELATDSFFEITKSDKEYYVPYYDLSPKEHYFAWCYHELYGGLNGLIGEVVEQEDFDDTGIFTGFLWGIGGKEGEFVEK